MRKKLPVIFYQTLSLFEEDKKSCLIGDGDFNSKSLSRSIKENLNLEPVIFKSDIEARDNLEKKLNFENCVGKRLDKSQFINNYWYEDNSLTFDSFSCKDLNIEELSYFGAFGKDLKENWISYGGIFGISGIFGGFTTNYFTGNNLLSLIGGLLLPTSILLIDSKKSVKKFKEWKKYETFMDKVKDVENSLNNSKTKIVEIKDFDAGYSNCPDVMAPSEFNRCIINEFSKQDLVKKFKRKNNPSLRY